MERSEANDGPEEVTDPTPIIIPAPEPVLTPVPLAQFQAETIAFMGMLANQIAANGEIDCGLLYDAIQAAQAARDAAGCPGV